MAIITKGIAGVLHQVDRRGRAMLVMAAQAFDARGDRAGGVSGGRIGHTGAVRRVLIVGLVVTAGSGVIVADLAEDETVDDGAVTAPAELVAQGTAGKRIPVGRRPVGNTHAQEVGIFIDVSMGIVAIVATDPIVRNIMPGLSGGAEALVRTGDELSLDVRTERAGRQRLGVGIVAVALEADIAVLLAVFPARDAMADVAAIRA